MYRYSSIESYPWSKCFASGYEYWGHHKMVTAKNAKHHSAVK